MSAHYVNEIMKRINENTNTTTNPGIIVASPSEDPPYKYHWIRDSALVMRPIVDMYKKHKDPKYFQDIMNYIENETKIQKLETLSGLGEPKININCTPFNGSWGRPQNDGPALRGIILLEIIDLMKYKYPVIIENMINPIINKDLDYILKNYNKVSFDLWEENIGWHFYTRLVQLKFLKDCISKYKYLSINQSKLDMIKETYEKLTVNIKDHLNENTIISSFNENGEIIKYEDSANILAFCHINYDTDILKIFPLEYIKHTCENLLDYFRNKYKDDSLNLIGRYKDDKYYNGHIWIICSLALAQVYLQLYIQSNIIRKTSPMHRAKSNPNNDYMVIANEILERILSLDTDFILPEQFDPTNNQYYSAKKLTWNYSELYILITKLM
jgi:glucoamylase